MWEKNPQKQQISEIKKIRNQKYSLCYSLQQKNEHNQHVYCKAPIAAHLLHKKISEKIEIIRKKKYQHSTNWTVVYLKYSFMYSSTHIVCVLKLTKFIRNMKYKFA